MMLSSLLSGCTSVTITTNKDVASVRQLNRLYVVVNDGQLPDKSLSDYLIAGLKGSFTNSPVEVKYGVVSALDLDPAKMTDQIKAFKPDAVLVVSLRTFVVDQVSDGYPTLYYDASLYDPDQNKRIWRASINNSGGIALMKRRMREMAQKISMGLQADGFLRGISVSKDEPVSKRADEP